VARTVRWTETAIQDLEEAAAFIGRDSRFYAAAEEGLMFANPLGSCQEMSWQAMRESA
jgi:plasmid stabilization system protein ParE